MVNSGSQGELARHRAGQQNMTPGPPPNPQAKRQAYQKDCDFANAGVDRRHNPQVQGANVSAAPAPKLGLAGQGQAQAWAPATLQTPLRPQQFPSSQPFVTQVTPWSCASPQPSMAQVQQQGQLTLEPSPRAQQGPAPACNPHQHGPSAMPLHQQYCDSSYAQASPDASRFAMPPDIGGGSVPTRQPWAGSPVACSAGLAAAMMGTQGPEPWAHSMRLQLEQTPYMQLPFPIRYMLASAGIMNELTERAHARSQQAPYAATNACNSTHCVDGCACTWNHPALRGMVKARTEAELLTALAALCRDGPSTAALGKNASSADSKTSLYKARTSTACGVQEQAARCCWDELKRSGCIVVDLRTGNFKWQTDAAQHPPYVFISASLMLKDVLDAVQMSRQDDASKGACAHAGSMQAAGLTGLVLPMELHPTMLCSRDGSWALRHPILNSHNRLLAVHLGDNDLMGGTQEQTPTPEQLADATHRLAALLSSRLVLAGRQYNYLTEKDGCYWFCAGDSLAPSDTFPKVVSHEHACALLGSVYMLPTVSGMSLRGGLFFSKTTPVSLKGVVFRIEPDLVDYDAKGRKHILTDGCGRASPDLWPLFKHAFDSHAAGRAASTADGSWNATSHKGPAPLLNRQALKAALGMGSSWPPIPEGGSGGVSSSELGGSRSRNPAASSGSMLSGGTAGQHQYPGYGTAPVGGRPAAASCSARSCSVDDRRAAEVAAAQNTAWGLHNLPTCHGAAADFGQLPPIQVRMHVPLSPAAAAAARTHAGRTEAACPWPVLALCKGTLSPDSLLPAGTIVVPFSMVKAPFITDAAESSAVMFSAVGSCNSAAGGAGATARDTPGSTQPLVGTWMYLQNACSEPCPVVHLEINSFAKTITRNSTQNLNATTIALLSGGGVPEKYFKDLLDAAVLDYNEGLETPLATAVRAKASGYEVCEQRILAGYGQEPLAYEGAPRQWAGSGANYADLQMCYDLHNLCMCQMERLYKLKLPMPNAYVAMGQPDVTRTLLERQVVLLDSSGQSLYEAPTPALLYRHPGLHPADIVHVTVVPPTEAISRRYGRYCNVLLMSTQGGESLAALSSGGDYDGDMFVLMTDPRLVLSYQPYIASTCLDEPHDMPAGATAARQSGAAFSSSGSGLGVGLDSMHGRGKDVVAQLVGRRDGWRAPPSRFYADLMMQMAQFHVHTQVCNKEMSLVPGLWNLWAEEKGPRSTQCILASHNYNALLDAKKCGTDPHIDKSLCRSNAVGSEPCWAMKLPAARAVAAIKAHEQATMHVHLPKGALQDSIMTKLCSAILRILPPEPRINDDQVEYMFAPDAQVLEWAKQQVEECDRAFWQGLDGMDLGPESSLDRWMKLLALAVGIYKTHWCGLWSHALAQDEGPAVTKKAKRTQSRRRDGRAKALQAAVKSELLGLCHSVVNLQAADPKFVARGPASPVHGMAAAAAAAYGDKLHKPAAGSTVNASVGSNSLHMTHGSPVHEPLNSNRWGVMAVAFYCAVYQTRAQEAQAESADLAKLGMRLGAVWKVLGDVLCRLKKELVAKACCQPGMPFPLHGQCQ